jgi:hypothetical protein
LVAACGGSARSGSEEAESRSKDARRRFIGTARPLFRKTVVARVTGRKKAGNHTKRARTKVSIGQMTRECLL